MTDSPTSHTTTPAGSVSPESATQRPAGSIDPRGPRVVATFTAALLLVGTYLSAIGVAARADLGTLGLGERVADPGVIAVAIVALLFAWSLVSASTQPLQAFFRLVVQPRLSPPEEWEDARPPRFAQGVGLVVVGIGLVLHVAGVPFALIIGAAAAFIAAFLNAAFGFCLGCELYLLLARLRSGNRAA